MTEHKKPKQPQGHQYPSHRVLSIYNKHISADHLALKRDYEALCPHTKLEFKFTDEFQPHRLAHVARKRGCDLIAYWETRRHTDLFLYLAAAPSGPTAKFHVFNIKSSQSMRFTGNFARFTRPVLNFSEEFEQSAPMRIAQELLKRCFQAPYLHFRQAPFIDHLFQFVVADRVSRQFDFHAYAFEFDDTVRRPRDGEDVVLREAGPGFSMVPVALYAGCMTGDTVWENPGYLTQGEVRLQQRLRQQRENERRANEREWKAARGEREALSENPVDAVFSARNFEAAFGE